MGSSLTWGKLGCINSNYDYSFKILMIGDSGVGKSTLLLSFISNSTKDHVTPTIGVDFKIKLLTAAGKRLKLTIWDTAGQERFGSLITSYYRGAHGIILVYDVTRRETFTNLSEIWAKEVDLYSTNQDCVKILVGNKVDMVGERAVSKEEGIALAQEHKCLFYECSAKTQENVRQCFKDLLGKLGAVRNDIDIETLKVLKLEGNTTYCLNLPQLRYGARRQLYYYSEEILESPSLLEKGSIVIKKAILKQEEVCKARGGGSCCS